MSWCLIEGDVTGWNQNLLFAFCILRLSFEGSGTRLLLYLEKQINADYTTVVKLSVAQER